MKVATSVPPPPLGSITLTLPLYSGLARSAQVCGRVLTTSVLTTNEGTPVKVATQPPLSPFRPAGSLAALGGM